MYKAEDIEKKFVVKGVYQIFTFALIIFFLIIFSNVIVQTLFFNKTATVNFSLIQVSINTIAYIGILIGSIVLLNRLSFKTIKLTSRSKLLLWVAGVSALFLLQIAFAKSYYRMSGWDVSAVLNGAYGLLNGEMEMPGYFIQNSNNIFLMIMFKWYIGMVIKLKIGDILLAVVILNIIFIDIAIGLIIVICNKLWGEVIAIASLLFSVPILGFTLWMVIPYSDTLSMLFPVLLFYLYLKSEENHKYMYFGFIGIISSVGWLLKPTNIIIVIAIVIIKILCSKLNISSITKFVKSAIIVGAFFILLQGGFALVREQVVGDYISVEDIKQNKNPFTHFLMMGMQKQEIGNGKYSYGAYLWEDVENTWNHVGQKEKIEYNMLIVRQRLKEFGFLGYMKFLYDKANWVCGDGTFYYGGEGEFYISEPPETGKIGKYIQSFAYVETERYQKYYSNILQGLWVTVLCFMIMGIVVNRKEYKNVNLSILRLSLIGILMFILMFEGRSRYLMNYLPVFILLAVYGLSMSSRLLHKRGEIK